MPRQAARRQPKREPLDGGARVQLTYDQVRERVASALERAAEAHEAERYREISGHFKDVDVPETRGEGTPFAKVGIALNFFDGWVDASNHDWLYYEGISQEDWPRFARLIARALRSDREVPTPVVLKHFDLRGSVRDPSILERRRRLAEDLACGALAAAAGLGIGWLDLHTTEVSVTVVALLATGIALGLLCPKAAWRWAVLLALGLPVLAVSAKLGRMRTAEPVQLDLRITLVALAFALVGAYAGVLLRRAATAATGSGAV